MNYHRRDTKKIDFDGIAGIKPVDSTYADVLQAWGDHFLIEHLPEDVLKSGRVIKAKTVLHFPDLGLVAVFETSDPLQPDTPVKVAGAEKGCHLQTPTGLHVGMRRQEALCLTAEYYQIADTCCGFTICHPLSTLTTHTELGLFYENDLVSFIGLYQQK